MTGAGPTTDYGFLADACADAGAAAFVHAGTRSDDDLRYLTRLGDVDRGCAFVYVAATAATTLCAPAGVVPRARRAFPGDAVRAVDADRSAGAAAAAVLEASTDGGTVLVPRALRHDVAVSVERAGFDLSSTAAVRRARAVKRDAELARHRRVQAAATAGVARAAAVLDEAAVDGDRLRWQGVPLTAERLRRAVDAELAREGVSAAGNTVVAAGPPSAARRVVDDPDDGHALAPGTPVRVEVSPRGPAGYHGDCARTYVVGGDGGWERRAHVAVEAARRNALAVAGPGVPARRVREEARAELVAHGFAVEDAGPPAPRDGDSDPDPDPDRDRGRRRALGHGVGLSRRERPSLRTGTDLAVGHVLSLAPWVGDPEVGDVRIADLVVVGEDGAAPLATLPTGLSPQPGGR